MGESLLPGAEEMERALGDLGVALDAVEADAEGVVRLTAPPGLLEEFIAPRLVEFAAQHPKVRLELDASVGYADLTRGEADIALRVRRPDRGDLVSRKLVSVRSLVLGAPQLVAAIGVLRHTDAAPWIAWGHELAQIPEARWMAKHVRTPPILRTSSFGSQLNAASAGLGLCLVPEVYARPHGLVAVRPGRALAAAFAELPVGDLWLVGHVALRRVPRVEAVWEFLVAELTKPWP
ncbi:MAG: LysR family transcriptional regulator [Deltaproteobacteria bacterium]|nr:LysR family transcriptional regulator [Deltaproteobacteria bacterium]